MIASFRHRNKQRRAVLGSDETTREYRVQIANVSGQLAGTHALRTTRACRDRAVRVWHAYGKAVAERVRFSTNVIDQTSGGRETGRSNGFWGKKLDSQCRTLTPYPHLIYRSSSEGTVHHVRTSTLHTVSMGTGQERRDTTIELPRIPCRGEPNRRLENDRGRLR